jgi:hypothetical protein
MAYLDPGMMRLFRRKIANPFCWNRVCGVLRSCQYRDLRSPAGAYGMVDGLCRCLGVAITPAERANAAAWIMNSGVNPANPAHRRAMWNLLWRY